MGKVPVIGMFHQILLLRKLARLSRNVGLAAGLIALLAAAARAYTGPTQVGLIVFLLGAIICIEATSLHVILLFDLHERRQEMIREQEQQEVETLEDN